MKAKKRAVGSLFKVCQIILEVCIMQILNKIMNSEKAHTSNKAVHVQSSVDENSPALGSTLCFMTLHTFYTYQKNK